VKAAALKLAASGIYVFPLLANGKAPATLHGYQDATKDPRRIEEMWGLLPKSNVGIATGASGLVVIDIDVKHAINGWKAFDDCLERLGELPGPTRMASTPSGGAHLYFRSPDGFEIRNSAGRLGPGLDVRARGGSIVCAPSTIDDKAYHWDITESVKVLPGAWAKAMAVPVRKAPEGRLPIAEHNDRRTRRYCVVANERACKDLRDKRLGERNDGILRYGTSMGGLIHTGGITEKEIEDGMHWACSHWDIRERDIRKDLGTLCRGVEWGRQHPRQLELQNG
jgi:hypothetical protein